MPPASAFKGTFVSPSTPVSFSENALTLSVVDVLRPLHFTDAHRWRTKADRLGAKRQLGILVPVTSTTIEPMDFEHFTRIKQRVRMYHPGQAMGSALDQVAQGAYVPIESLPGAATLSPLAGGRHYIFDVDSRYQGKPHAFLLEVLHLTADAAETAELGAYNIDDKAVLRGDMAGLVAQARVYYSFSATERRHVIDVAHDMESSTVDMSRARYFPILELFAKSSDCTTFCKGVLDGTVEERLRQLYPVFSGESLTAQERRQIVTTFGTFPVPKHLSSFADVPTEVHPSGLWERAVRDALALDEPLVYPTLLALAKRLEEGGFFLAARSVLDAAFIRSAVLPVRSPSYLLAWKARLEMRLGHHGAARRLFTAAIGAGKREHDEDHPFLAIAIALADVLFYSTLSTGRVIEPFPSMFFHLLHTLADDSHFDQLIEYFTDGKHWQHARSVLWHDHTLSAVDRTSTSTTSRLTTPGSPSLGQPTDGHAIRARTKNAISEWPLFLSEIERLRQANHVMEAWGSISRIRKALSNPLMTESDDALSYRHLTTYTAQTLASQLDAPPYAEIAMQIGKTLTMAAPQDAALRQTVKLLAEFIRRSPSKTEARRAADWILDHVETRVHERPASDDALRVELAGYFTTPELADRGLRLLGDIPSDRQTLAIRLVRLHLKVLTHAPDLQDEYPVLEREVIATSLKDSVRLALIEHEAQRTVPARLLLDAVLADSALTTLHTLAPVVDDLIRLGEIDAVESFLHRARGALAAAARSDFVAAASAVAKARMANGDYVQALTVIRGLTPQRPGCELLMDLAMAVSERYHLMLPEGPMTAFLSNAVSDSLLLKTWATWREPAPDDIQRIAERAVARAERDITVGREDHHRPRREQAMQSGATFFDDRLDGWLLSVRSVTLPFRMAWGLMTLPARLTLDSDSFPDLPLEWRAAIRFVSVVVVLFLATQGPVLWLASIAALLVVPWSVFQITWPWIGSQYVLPGSLENIQPIHDAVERVESDGIQPILVLAGEQSNDDTESQKELSQEVLDAKAQRLAERYIRLAQEFPNSGMKRHISIKLSAFYGDFAAHQQQLVPLVKQMAEACRASGVTLTLDGERLKDRDAHVAIFKAVHRQVNGWDGLGLVVQAYAQDSQDVIRDLIKDAKSRHARFRIRLVKGAYWQQEHEDGALPVWNSPDDTDLNFRACTALLFANADTVYPMIASMRDREQAFAFEMAQDVGLANDRWESQMLYGMQMPLLRRMRERQQPVSLYMVFGSVADALPYFARRRDEITGPSAYAKRYWDFANSARHLAQYPKAQTSAMAAVIYDSWWGRLYRLGRGDDPYTSPVDHDSDLRALALAVEAFARQGRFSPLGMSAADIFDTLTSEVSVSDFVAHEMAPWLELDFFLPSFEDVWSQWPTESIGNVSDKLGTFPVRSRSGVRTNSVVYEDAFQAQHPYPVRKAYHYILDGGLHFLHAAWLSGLSLEDTKNLVASALVASHRSWNNDHPVHLAVPSLLKRMSSNPKIGSKIREAA